MFDGPEPVGLTSVDDGAVVDAVTGWAHGEAAAAARRLAAIADWNVHTAQLPPPAPDAPTPENRALRMPRRHRTRTQDTTQRIKNRQAREDTS